MTDAEAPVPTIVRFAQSLGRVVDGPVTWVRETIVQPNQQKYNWYHRKYRRVPTVDQCYTDDPVCFNEADLQFRRDKMVDSEILFILKSRAEQCVFYHGGLELDGVTECQKLWDIHDENAANWFSKYGDLGHYGTAKDAYMKEKHRLIWERRHGPVGSGMKQKE